MDAPPNPPLCSFVDPAKFSTPPSTVRRERENQGLDRYIHPQILQDSLMEDHLPKIRCMDKPHLQHGKFVELFSQSFVFFLFGAKAPVCGVLTQNM